MENIRNFEKVACRVAIKRYFIYGIYEAENYINKWAEVMKESKPNKTYVFEQLYLFVNLEV